MVTITEYNDELKQNLPNLRNNHKGGDNLSPLECYYVPHFTEYCLVKLGRKYGDVIFADDWNKFVDYLNKLYGDKV